MKLKNHMTNEQELISLKSQTSKDWGEVQQNKFENWLVIVLNVISLNKTMSETDYMNNNITTICKDEPVGIGILIEKKYSWNRDFGWEKHSWNWGFWLMKKWKRKFMSREGEHEKVKGK